MSSRQAFIHVHPLYTVLKDLLSSLRLVAAQVADCYSEPHLLVEVSDLQPWTILRINQAAVRVTGAIAALPHARQSTQTSQNINFVTNPAKGSKVRPADKLCR